MRRIYCDVCGNEIQDPSFDGLAGRFDVRSACPDVKDVCPSCSSYLKGLSVSQAVLDAWKMKAGLDGGGRGKKKKKPAGKAVAKKDAAAKEPGAARTGKRTGRPRKSKQADEPDVVRATAIAVAGQVPVADSVQESVPETAVSDADGEAVRGSVQGDAAPEPAGRGGDDAAGNDGAVEDDPVRDRPPAAAAYAGQSVGAPAKERPVGGVHTGRSVEASTNGSPIADGHAVQSVVPDKPVGYGIPSGFGTERSVQAAANPPARRGRKPKSARIDPVTNSADAALKGRIMRALMSYRVDNGVGSLNGLADEAGVTADELRRALSAERFEVSWWQKVEAGLRKMGRSVGDQ